MISIHKRLLKEGIDSYIVWGRGRGAEDEHEMPIVDQIGVRCHGVYTRLTDRTGFASKRATKKLVTQLDDIKPDIIHLHNIHGYFINIEMLFGYIKKNRVKVIWTLHDCWPFTGHCAYFDMIGCEKWKTGCNHCSQLATYPASWNIDSSEWNWKKKKELFTGTNITLVTPCKWLKDLVSQSYLSEYPVEVIYNGLDMSIYKPHKGAIREKWALNNDFIILGVANEWTKRKGLEDFVKLERKLKKENFMSFKIVLVGLTKEQVKQLPKSMIRLRRTANVDELLELYTEADVYFNPTYEDNYPTTNIEAIACGTPVITYNTGGSPESISRKVGVIYEQGDIDSVVEYIKGHNTKKMGFDICPVDHKKLLDEEIMVEQYLDLYESVSE